MNRKISFGAAVALLLIVAAFVFSITMDYARRTFNERVNDLRDRENLYSKYSEIDGLIRAHYYGTIDENKLMNSVAAGYVAGVGDQYGRYISAEEYKRMIQEEEGGDDVGIGAVIEIAPDDFYLVVVEVYPDSPAEVAGIEAGDLIIQVDDTELSRENSSQMLDAIRGPQGSNLSVVTRRGSADTLPIVMTRRAVPVPTVLYGRMLEDSTVGYLYISEFRDRTYDQFNRELLNLMDAGATSLIIDLRDNQSDVLRSATRVLDKLLPEGVLVSAAYKDGTTEVLADSDANAINLPVVVLTNEGTTGVSELFAQAIKDFDKGRTVGVSTAGKGVMQEILKLSDGSALELSVATYLSPSGQSWSGTGVKADFDVTMEGDWKQFIENESGDAQLTKAKEVAVSLQKNVPLEEREPEQDDGISLAEEPDGEEAEPSEDADDGSEQAGDEEPEGAEDADEPDEDQDTEE